MFRRRLVAKVYLALLGTILLGALAAGISHQALREEGAERVHLHAFAALLLEGLPEAEPQRAEALTLRARRLGLHVSLWGRDRALQVRVGEPLPAPRAESRPFRWVHGAAGWGARLKLRDGRWLAVIHEDPEARPPLGRFLLALILFTLVLSLGAIPISRLITRRIEAVQGGLRRFGEGDLGARVPVHGHDEVAQLAAAFNEAAERVQRLVEAQKRVLASASHELRSPLARLRMAVELMGEGVDPALASGAHRDVEELDALIGDILLSARLGSGAALRERGAVDLLGLAVEEAQAVGAEVEGAPALVIGHEGALRRLIRNLLENAARYGEGAPITVEVHEADEGVTLIVSDEGPGVPEAEAARIFEPFYRAPHHAEGRDGGVGLGLALAREIAEAHGGALEHAPRPGGGGRFIARLPHSGGAAPDPTQ